MWAFTRQSHIHLARSRGYKQAITMDFVCSIINLHGFVSVMFLMVLCMVVQLRRPFLQSRCLPHERAIPSPSAHQILRAVWSSLSLCLSMCVCVCLCVCYQLLQRAITKSLAGVLLQPSALQAACIPSPTSCLPTSSFPFPAPEGKMRSLSRPCGLAGGRLNLIELLSWGLVGAFIPESAFLCPSIFRLVLETSLGGSERCLQRGWSEPEI